MRIVRKLIQLEQLLNEKAICKESDLALALQTRGCMGNKGMGQEIAG